MNPELQELLEDLATDHQDPTLDQDLDAIAFEADYHYHLHIAPHLKK